MTWLMEIWACECYVDKTNIVGQSYETAVCVIADFDIDTQNVAKKTARDVYLFTSI